MIINRVIFITLALFSFSCESDNKTRTYRLPKSKMQVQTESSSSQSRGIKWRKPTSWIPSSGSSMRLASFDVPYKGGVGDFSLIQLAGDGGGIVPNINRWRGQLGLEPQLKHEIESSMVDKEGLLGMYKIINIMNDQDSSAFLAAIIPLEKHTLFAKLSINISAIADVESDFIEFCSSIYITQ